MAPVVQDHADNCETPKSVEGANVRVRSSRAGPELDMFADFGTVPGRNDQIAPLRSASMPPPPPSDLAGGRRDGSGTTSRLPARIDQVTVAIIAVVLVPFVVAGVYALVHFGPTYTANDDNALNELVIKQIGSRLVLLGPYSRPTWSHPGPFFYYLMWIPYRLFGSTSSALMAGALSINAAATAGCLWLANRWGGKLFLTLAGLGFAWFTIRLPSGMLWNPWNPFVTVLPFALFLLLVWASLNGDRFGLPAAAVVGTFCAQTHIVYLPIVAGCLFAALIHAIVRSRAQSGGGSVVGARHIWLFVVAVVALWTPALLDQLLSSPGNVTSILKYLGDGGPTKTLLDGYRAVAAQFTLSPEWVTGLRPVSDILAEPTALKAAQWPLLVLPFGIATAASWRGRGSIQMRNLFTLLWAVMAISVVALARTVGPMYEYRLRWLWVVAMLATAATVWWVLDLIALPRGFPVMKFAAGAMAACAIAGAGTLLAADPPGLHDAHVVDRLVAQVERSVPRSGVTEIVASSFETAADVPGVLLRLRAAGYDVRVLSSPDDRLRYGTRILTDSPDRRLILLGNQQIESAEQQSFGIEVARVSKLGPSARRDAQARLVHLRSLGLPADHKRALKLLKTGASLSGRAAVLDQVSSDDQLIQPTDRKDTNHHAVVMSDGLGVEMRYDLIADVAAHPGWSGQVVAEPFLAPCDWARMFRRVVRSTRPDVIGMLGAGDSGPTSCMVGSSGEEIALGSPEYLRRYRIGFTRLFAAARREQIPVVYFEPPPFSDPVREAAARSVTAMVRMMARTHSGLTISSSVRDALSIRGRYVGALPCEPGEVASMGCARYGFIAVRTAPGHVDDGLHFCPAGLGGQGTRLCPVYSSGAHRAARVIADVLTKVGHTPVRT